MLLFVCLAACRPSTSVTPTPQSSAWGPVITLAEAPQTAAPVLLPLHDRVAAAWVGADETGVYQYMRNLYSTAALSATERLPLPPVHPHQQMLSPAAQQHTHLIWRDAAYDDPTAGEYLWSAVVTPDLLVERGPSRVAPPPVYQYTTIPTGDNGIWLIWSSGLRAEPTLNARLIDAIGRPRLPIELTTQADFPTAVEINSGSYRVFWQDAVEDLIYMGEFRGGMLNAIMLVSETVLLNRGDWLIDFFAGQDMTTVYLFWEVQRATGEVETWYTSGTPDEIPWEPPVRLGIHVTTGDVETTFNGGAALAATTGENWIEWSSVMPGQFDRLALAAQFGSILGIVFFQAGEVIAYRNVVTTGEIGLLDSPVLYTDTNRHLYLAWSQPTPDGYARLNLTMTR